VAETRKLAAILAADVAGYSRLAGIDEDRTLARLRALRSDLIDPTISVHHGRVVKRTGDGALIEFRSVVDAVRCAIEVQNSMLERNAGLPPERRIEFRIGIHLGDVVQEIDGDVMGDGVNIAARLEGIAKPGTICLSEDAYRQVKGRLELAVRNLGFIRWRLADLCWTMPSRRSCRPILSRRVSPSLFFLSPTWAAIPSKIILSTA
jgi:adenylate cyclase